MESTRTNWHDWMRDVKKIDPSDAKTISLIWEVIGIAMYDAGQEASPTLSTATNRQLLQEVLLRCPHLDLHRRNGGMDYLRDCTESVVLGHCFLGLIGPEGE